ncbi:MAG: DUF1080 domain-containing protein [Thermoguttaceae bacterium]|nr:DUF1080 domain-containing protein [Thermoguttaceae bacterium]
MILTQYRRRIATGALSISAFVGLAFATAGSAVAAGFGPCGVFFQGPFAAQTACAPCAPVCAAEPVCVPVPTCASCVPCGPFAFLRGAFATPCFPRFFGFGPAFCQQPVANTSECYYCGATPYVPAGLKTPLFNGEDLTGWTNVKGEKPGDGWKVVDGAIFREKNTGDLYVDGKFENFVLEFEFKLADKGNSGVKYRSWNTDGFGMGCEYQIYDDIADEKNPPRYQTGALYDVIPPREGSPKIKMGEYNTGKIVVAGDHIMHYLNGELVVSTYVGSKEWNEKVAASKFKDTKEFGTTKVGRIFLQDHQCQVWFKNIYVTKLTPARPATGCVIFR